MKRLNEFLLACRIEWHWWFIQRWKKRGIRMIERGTPLTSPELIRLSQKITRHGMVALHLQNKFEKEELS